MYDFRFFLWPAREWLVINVINRRFRDQSISKDPREDLIYPREDLWHIGKMILMRKPIRFEALSDSSQTQRVLGLSEEDIIRLRTRNPFNLPLDPESMPVFASIELRYSYIMMKLIKSRIEILNRKWRSWRSAAGGRTQISVF
jgi:hypothetical protein